MALSERRDLAIQAAPSAPAEPTLPKIQKKSYASPMSYVGISRRMIAFARRNSNPPAKGVVAWTIGIAAMLIMWSVITMWYVLIFGVFGLLVIPFRLIRRSQRKSLHVQQQQLATMQAMAAQQARR